MMPADDNKAGALTTAATVDNSCCIIAAYTYSCQRQLLQWGPIKPTQIKCVQNLSQAAHVPSGYRGSTSCAPTIINTHTKLKPRARRLPIAATRPSSHHPQSSYRVDTPSCHSHTHTARQPPARRHCSTNSHWPTAAAAQVRPSKCRRSSLMASLSCSNASSSRNSRSSRVGCLREHNRRKKCESYIESNSQQINNP